MALVVWVGQLHLDLKVAYNVVSAAHSPRPGGGLGAKSGGAKSVGKLDAIALVVWAGL